MKTTEKTNYQQTIQKVFLQRIQRNPRYSLRSFARDLGIGAAQISLVLNRKKGLSTAQAKRIAQALQLTSKEGEIFCLQVQAQHERNQALKSHALKTLEQVLLPNQQPEHAISETELELCTEWYVLAVFELLKLRNPPTHAQALADALGIHIHEVHAATGVLTKLGLISTASVGWNCLAEALTTSAEIPSLAIKKFHSQMYREAEQKLYEIPVEQRHLLSMVFPFAEEQLPEIKRTLDRFLARFTQKFVQKEKANQVGTLLLHFFPLSKIQSAIHQPPTPNQEK